jgi:hypothetical protein
VLDVDITEDAEPLVGEGRLGSGNHVLERTVDTSVERVSHIQQEGPQAVSCADDGSEGRRPNRRSTDYASPTFSVTRNSSGGSMMPATVPIEWTTVTTGASGTATAQANLLRP